jgi:hypothetical protein
LALSVWPPKPPFIAIGFSWISLDSLVRIETYQWVMRDFRDKKFSLAFSLSLTSAAAEACRRDYAEAQNYS